MKHIRYFVFVIIVLINLTACNTTQKLTHKKDPTQKFLCQVNGNVEGQALYVYEFDGLGFKLFQVDSIAENNIYQFDIPVSLTNHFYYVGTDKKNWRVIILGKEPDVKLIGNISNFKKSKIINSPINDAYSNAKKEIRKFKTKSNNLSRDFRKAAKMPAKQKEVIKQMAILDKEKKMYLDSIRAKDAFLGKIVAINTFYSYHNNREKYSNEILFFINEFFSQVDFKDNEYGNFPYLYEQFRSFTETLTRVGLTEKRLIEYLDLNLNKIPKDTRTYKLALGGIVNGLLQRNSTVVVEYGTRYLEKFGNENSPSTQGLTQRINSLKTLVIGAEAPNFTELTPEGKQLSLYDLKGNIVLIDFWASWCGPCRRENPNVVKLYNKYKNKGFEVLGVSLDKKKQAWLGAIAKDKLTWHHVSDLKGWSSKVARNYNVRSIPQTVLLDQDGKIIARNLRGEQLAHRLKELFGE